MRKSLFALLLAVALVGAAVMAFLPGETANAENAITGVAPEDEITVVPLVMEMTATQREKETQTVETPEPVEVPKLATERDIELIARTIWGEAEVVDSTAERAAVAWCILNRVDDSGKPIESVILAPYQFYCREEGNVPAWAIELAEDVVGRWERERAGETNVGRTIPADYLYFIGDGWHNHFSIEWRSTDYWDWSLPDPYKY